METFSSAGAHNRTKQVAETTLAASELQDVPPIVNTQTSRLAALDAFRGLTILLMVLVNNGNGPASYPQLEHSAWHGWTLTDTVFPSFLWIVGVAITLSLGKRLQTGVDRRTLLLPIARRAAILFALGLLFNLFPAFDLPHGRILGVLQRIAICYFFASLIYLYFGVRGQIIWIAGLFLAYWSIMTWLPVPGFGAGRFDIEGNFAHYVDQTLLGVHNYRSTKTWDPEGFVSTLPSIGTALLGIMAGHILRLRYSLESRICSLFFTGCLLIVTGLFWSNWMPINKKIWTNSFALFMGGLDFLVLGCFLWFVDVLGFRRAVKPLLIVGMNSIAVYTASELILGLLGFIKVSAGNQPMELPDYVFSHFYEPIASAPNASLLWALTITATMYAFAYLLYRRHWFWRV
jgi:predicted acyltransferase